MCFCATLLKYCLSAINPPFFALLGGTGSYRLRFSPPAVGCQGHQEGLGDPAKKKGLFPLLFSVPAWWQVALSAGILAVLPREEGSSLLRQQTLQRVSTLSPQRSDSVSSYFQPQGQLLFSAVTSLELSTPLSAANPLCTVCNSVY